MEEDKKESMVRGLEDILEKVSEEIVAKREEAEGLKQKAKGIIEVANAVFEIFKEVESRGIRQVSVIEKWKTIGIFCCDGIKRDFHTIELLKPEKKVLIDIGVTNAIKKIREVLFLEPMPADDIQELKEWISKMQSALTNNHLSEFLEIVQQITSQTLDGFKVEI